MFLDSTVIKAEIHHLLQTSVAIIRLFSVIDLILRKLSIKLPAFECRLTNTIVSFSE